MVLRKGYKYSVGEVIGNLKILGQTRIKNGNTDARGYTYECLKCGNIDDTNEYNISKGNRCSVCNGKKVLKGYNDIATTHPDLVRYFYNKDDTYLYRAGSNKKVEMICPSCKSKRKMEINKLKTYGFSCQKCSDGISYPEKFMMSVLDQIGIKYVTQYSPEWAKPRRYDFFITGIGNKKIIVETDGDQHFSEGGKLSHYKKLDEQIKIDNEKEILARKYGLELIRIDCSKSNSDYIKNSILNSKLPYIMDLDNIDWNKCNESAINSKVKEVCNLWARENKKDIQILSNTTKLHRDTIRKYLKIGNKLGWCDYDVGMFKNKGVGKAVEKRKNSIICLNTGDIFNSINDCSRASEEVFGTKLIRQGISNVCRGKNNTYKNLKFKYIDDLIIKNIAL